MDYGMRIRLAQPYAAVVQRVREALKEQGFGVLTEIDVRVTLRHKLGEEIEDYLILGACNPAAGAPGAAGGPADRGCRCRATWWSAPTAPAPSWRRLTRK